MAKRTRRRRRSWSRLLLLVVFVAAALYAGYFCLFRPPEVPAETTQPNEAEEVSAEDAAQDAEALAQAAHLERKPYFYTILVSGVAPMCGRAPSPTTASTSGPTSRPRTPTSPAATPSAT